MPHSKSHRSITSLTIQEETQPIIEVRQVSRSFSDKVNSRGLQNISFTIQVGQVCAIIGESGSGKSTLLKLIYGLLKVDDGQILFEGQKVKGPDEKLIPGHDAMRMVTQNFDDLNTYAKVWDNVASQLSNTDLTKKQSKTAEILDRLRIGHLKDHRIADLSGGEKQRVAIARALINEPQVLLMDEPFNQIDSAFREQLQADIRQIVDETGLTLILVSHDPAEVLGLANYLVILNDGKITAQGSAINLYQNPPNAYVARVLSKSNILNKEQAASLGLKKCEIAIHPESLQLELDPSGDFHIEKTIYRGFYQEIIVRKGELRLRAYQMNNQEWPNKQTVKLVIRQYTRL